MWTLEKVWRSTQDPKYLAYIKKYVDQHVNAAGNVSGFTEGIWTISFPATPFCFSTSKPRGRSTERRRYMRQAFATYPRNSDGGFCIVPTSESDVGRRCVHGRDVSCPLRTCDGDTTAFDEVSRR